MLVVVVLAVLFVAYANGANDNFKGVATLFGSGSANYRASLAWATLCTFAGSLTALFVAERLIKALGGEGLLSSATVGSPSFILSVAAGTALTVMLASLLSMPISTTHGLVGALLGAGFAMASSDVGFSRLGATFLVPLVASPILAIGMAAGLYPLFRALRVAMGITRESCVCVDPAPAVVTQEGVTGGGGALAVGTCRERYRGTLLRLGAQETLQVAHVLSAGAVSFARGLNDTPKLVAMLVAAKALGTGSGHLIVGLAMAVGAILHARRVAETMSRKITPMNHGQGFTANLVTAFLVIFAARLGLPVSTTHVSCGALFGIGFVTRQVRWRIVAAIATAWMTTLPIAALVSYVVALVVNGRVS